MMKASLRNANGPARTRKFLRAFACAALCLPALCVGCASGPCSTGWRFEMGKPGTVQTQLPYAQTSGSLGILPMGTIGLDSRVAVVGAQSQFATESAQVLPMPTPVGPLATRRVVSPPTDCTLQEMCDLLRAIAAAQGVRPATARPMPKEKD